MAIRHEGIPEEELSKFEKGVLKIEAREIPGVGLEVDARGCLGDNSYLALAGKLVGLVLKNMRPTDDHDRIIDMTRAMTLLNHLAGVNHEFSAGVDRSHREDIKPASPASPTAPLTDDDKRQLTPGKMEIVAIEDATGVRIDLKGQVTGRALSAMAAQLVAIQHDNLRDDDHPFKRSLIETSLKALNILAGASADEAQGQRKSERMSPESVGNA